MQARSSPRLPPHGRTWRHPSCCRRPNPWTVQRQNSRQVREPHGRGRRAQSQQGQGLEGPGADRRERGFRQRRWRRRELPRRGGNGGTLRQRGRGRTCSTRQRATRQVHRWSPTSSRCRRMKGGVTRGMVVAGGQRQPAVPNVPAAAMKLILPAVQRKQEGKGGRGQQEQERQAAGAPAGTQGDRSGRAREGRNRQARQEPRRPQSTRGGAEEKQVDRGTSGRGPNRHLGSGPRVAATG